MTTWHQKHKEALTFGDKLSNMLATGMGSWKFIIIQTIFVVTWITLNIVGVVQRWDIYPFILLNLIFSTQAAYAAPIIMMAQNRQSDRDRHHAEADYETNKRAKEEIETLQKNLSRIEIDKLDKILALLEKK